MEKLYIVGSIESLKAKKKFCWTNISMINQYWAKVSVKHDMDTSLVCVARYQRQHSQ